tara:strand:- start:533 stop:1648 length:1116 start_codon:yes stop_codon:yes gene_type:complete
MNWIKVFFINAGLTFCLLGMLLMAPPLSYSLYSLVVSDGSNSSASDSSSKLALYKEFAWAEKHFIEFAQLPTTYHDFIIWRRDDFTGETVNIVDGVRNTIGSQVQDDQSTQYYFFGGSTTWGTGVNDDNTYPSLFAQLTNRKAFNLGESGYIARQSLAYLNNLIINESMDDMSGKHVVFYDGVNDVATRCRAEISGLGTGRESQIQNVLASPSSEKYSFLTTFNQLMEFVSHVSQKLGIVSSEIIANSYYNCYSNPARSQEIARTLVDTWQATSDLVEQRGGKFTAVLQPVAYIGSPITSYLNLISENDEVLAAQFKSVYPLIKEIAERRNIDFIDLTYVYDGCDNCYIDFCHVGPQGHQILVSTLVKHIP